MQAAIKEEHEALHEQLGTAQSNGDAERVAQLQDQLDTQSDLLRALYVQSRTEGFGDEVKRRIMLGTYALSAGHYDKYYEKAQRVRTLIRHDFLQAFEEVDVLLTPATPTPAFQRGEKTADPLQMYLSDVYTVPANLAGVPGLSVPIGTHPDAPHLPVGAQFLAAPFDEAGLLHVGDALMKNVPA
jgi:aspartyl-tRNA(Asn)/glutamyl-tRNA(Gln) amidotransferase subunit A